MFVGVATTRKTTLPPCYNQYIPQMAAKIVWVQILCIVTYQKLKVCVGILQYSFPRRTCTVYMYLNVTRKIYLKCKYMYIF